MDRFHVGLARVRLARVSMILAAGTSLSCHEAFSNDDLLYLLALPRELEVELPGEATTSSGLAVAAASGLSSDVGNTPAKFFLDASRTADEINSGVLSITHGIGLIARSAEPSLREENVRIFGPFRDGRSTSKLIVVRIPFVDTGTTVSFTSRSTAVTVDALYDFRLCVDADVPALDPLRSSDCGDDGSVTLIAGRSVAGSEAEDGMGVLFVNGEALRILEGKSKPEPLSFIRYDTRREDTIIELVADVGLVPGESPFTNIEATYVYHGNRARGLFLFAVKEDLVRPVLGASTLETMAIAAHWLEDGRGRADVVVSGEDVESVLGHPNAGIVECWDTAFDRVFLTANYPLEPPLRAVGDVSACGPGLEQSSFEEAR